MIEIVQADIRSVRIDACSGQSGDASKKEWILPARLHIIAEINERKTDEFSKQYQLYCTIKKDQETIRKGVRFIAGNTGCKNPCRKRQLTGQSDPIVVFTVEITEPGEYTAIIGNTPIYGHATDFTIKSE